MAGHAAHTRRKGAALVAFTPAAMVLLMAGTTAMFTRLSKAQGLSKR